LRPAIVNHRPAINNRSPATAGLRPPTVHRRPTINRRRPATGRTSPFVGEMRRKGIHFQVFCHSELARNLKLHSEIVPEIPRKLGMT
jgi:hypothetical protein